MRYEHDEYKWEKYSEDYIAQYHEMRATSGDNGSEWLLADWTVGSDGKISFKTKLHGNWREIYQCAFDLKPKSVYEVGCGACHHLANIKTLLPDCQVAGADLLQSQIDFGKKTFAHNAEMMSNIRQIDFTQKSATNGLGKYEFVYSQAVVMHLSTENAHKMIRNMSAISSKYIMLVEGVAKHDYVKIFGDLGLLSSHSLTRPNNYIANAFLLTLKRTTQQ